MKGPPKTPLLLLLCLLAAPDFAAVLDGVFEVRSAYLTVDEGVFKLNARTEYPVSDQIRSALTDGVTLTFDLETRVDKARRLWLDATVVELMLRRELSWHAVRERFVVRDRERGEQDYYVSLEQALEAIGVVENFPVVTDPQLEPDGSYEISVRASVRRGSMPDALRSLVWWSDSWHRRTDWYSWALPR